MKRNRYVQVGYNGEVSIPKLVAEEFDIYPGGYVTMAVSNGDVTRTREVLVGYQGTIVIPKTFRDEFDIYPGDHIHLSIDNNRVVRITTCES